MFNATGRKYWLFSHASQLYSTFLLWGRVSCHSHFPFFTYCLTYWWELKSGNTHNSENKNLAITLYSFWLQDSWHFISVIKMCSIQGFSNISFNQMPWFITFNSTFPFIFSFKFYYAHVSFKSSLVQGNRKDTFGSFWVNMNISYHFLKHLHCVTFQLVI